MWENEIIRMMMNFEFYYWVYVVILYIVLDRVEFIKLYGQGYMIVGVIVEIEEGLGLFSEIEGLIFEEKKQSFNKKLCQGLIVIGKG